MSPSLPQRSCSSRLWHSRSFLAKVEFLDLYYPSIVVILRKECKSRHCDLPRQCLITLAETGLRRRIFAESFLQIEDVGRLCGKELRVSSTYSKLDSETSECCQAKLAKLSLVSSTSITPHNNTRKLLDTRLRLPRTSRSSSSPSCRLLSLPLEDAAPPLPPNPPRSLTILKRVIFLPECGREQVFLGRVTERHDRCW